MFTSPVGQWLRAPRLTQEEAFAIFKGARDGLNSLSKAVPWHREMKITPPQGMFHQGAQNFFCGSWLGTKGTTLEILG